MADSTSRSTFPLSRFLSLQTDTGLAEDDDEDELYECVASIEDEEHFGTLLHKEKDGDRIQLHVDDWIKMARSEAIQWIINMRSFLQFRFHTAYLSIIYIDRFILKGHITSDKEWAIRLLAVACLSLAAKMNERKAWTLSAFQTAEYNFERSVIQRMERLVLTTLDWRMHSITPFHFFHYLISCFCKECSNRRFISLITQIVCATAKDMNIMAHRSSTIAMAATLMVMDQNLTRESLEIKLKATRVNQLFDHEEVYTCYCRMLELEPVKVNIFEPDLANYLQNPSVGTKRKRLTFSDAEK